MLENEVRIIDKFLEWGNLDKRVRKSWDSIKKFIEESCQQHLTQAKAAEALPEGEITPCARKKDCSYIRINGECMGVTCGVYLPA